MIEKGAGANLPLDLGIYLNHKFKSKLNCNNYFKGNFLFYLDLGGIKIYKYIIFFKCNLNVIC